MFVQHLKFNCRSNIWELLTSDLALKLYLNLMWKFKVPVPFMFTQLNIYTKYAGFRTYINNQIWMYKLCTRLHKKISSKLKTLVALLICLSIFLAILHMRKDDCLHKFQASSVCDAFSSGTSSSSYYANMTIVVSMLFFRVSKDNFMNERIMGFSFIEKARTLQFV